MAITEIDNFNFGFRSILFYIEKVKGLKETFDLSTPLDPCKVHNGGIMIKAYNMQVSVVMQKLGHGFDVAITDPLGTSLFIFMKDGDELQEFFNNMIVQIDHDQSSDPF